MPRKKEPKEYKAGDVVAIRTKKDTPQYLMDLINQVVKEGGSSALFNYLLVGIKETGVRQKKGIYVPVPPDLTPEDLRKIEDNEALMILLGNIIKSSVSFDHPLQLSFSSIVANQTDKAQEPEMVGTDKMEKITKPINKKARRVNALKGKGLANLKQSFDKA